MFGVVDKAALLLGLLTLGITPRASVHCGRAPCATSPRGTPQPILMIRVSQESNPGAGDFEQHILGFVQALQTNGHASDFYQSGQCGPSFCNTDVPLSSNMSHAFFVNAADGLALFVVQNRPNHMEEGKEGTAKMLWELSGGTAAVLIADDSPDEEWANDAGTVFTMDCGWAASHTDGMVVGALPAGFTLLGQFTAPPTGLTSGWEVLSRDGSFIGLSLVPGQRVRLDVALHVNVRQDY